MFVSVTSFSIYFFLSFYPIVGNFNDVTTAVSECCSCYVSALFHHKGPYIFLPSKKKAKKPALGCIVVIYGPLLSGAHPFALAYQFGHLMIDAKGGGGGRTIKKKGKKNICEKKNGGKKNHNKTANASLYILVHSLPYFFRHLRTGMEEIMALLFPIISRCFVVKKST